MMHFSPCHSVFFEIHPLGKILFVYLLLDVFITLC